MILLDDLQWSDDATLELLATLAAGLRSLPVLVIGAYRSDEIDRLHPLRGLRHHLRRERLLRELVLEPLSAAETVELAEAVLGLPISAPLGELLHAPTPGDPLLRRGARGRAAHERRRRDVAGGLALEADAAVPLPETIRDAVLLRAAPLRPTPGPRPRPPRWRASPARAQHPGQARLPLAHRRGRARPRSSACSAPRSDSAATARAGCKEVA